MQVWFPTQKQLAQPDMRSPENRKFQAVTASHTFDGDSVDAILMPSNPESSQDTSIPRWTSWPQTGKQQWVQIQLKQPASIRSIGVYFYDDQGGVQVPGKWTIEIPNGDQGWKELKIYNTDQFSVLADSYNTVHPAETLTTDRFRIQMTPQHPQTSVGILSVDVETDQ